MAKRVFIIVLDSFGIGEAPDASKWGDEGSNTLAAVCSASNAPFPNLSRLGLFNISGHKDSRILDYIASQDRSNLPSPIGSYGRLYEVSEGKDTTIGHWEISDIISSSPLPTYPDGFPAEIIDQLSKETGRSILCNKPASGTEVIAEYGEEHMKTGSLIVYTSADSVLQIAAHEDIIPVETLYEYCRIARRIMAGPHGVGRIIARPFIGTPGNFTRTDRRHDFSLVPPSTSMLDVLKSKNFDVISIGKIVDIFAERGITESFRTHDNTDGIAQTLRLMDTDFNGLCFINLVDFDMKYGHRNDIEGYAAALHEFDTALETILDKLAEDDLLIVTADHGCDPSTASTDHSRESIPLLVYGEGHNSPQNLGSVMGFNYISTLVYNALLGDDATVKASQVQNFCPPCDSHIPDPSNIMSYVDLTNLKTTARLNDIYSLIDSAIAQNCASVCIQPCNVRDAYIYAAGRINICTVIGFPNGYNTTACKLFEADEAISNGASEIDMVINLTYVKDCRYDDLEREIALLSDLCHRRGAILKVIIETCALTPDEIIKMCEIVTTAGADFIKTSTGFGSEGATVDNVALMRANVGSEVRIKAAGGIRSIDTAQAMLEAGAIRIGASGIKH